MPYGPIYSAIVGFFESDDWNFQSMEGMPVLSMPFTGRNGKWMCYAQARERQEQFVFYSVAPVNAPEDRAGAVVEFITRANYGMIIGNFEFDYSDGEIRYKTSVDVEGSELLPALVRHMVYANVIIMDRYLSGLMRVIYAEASPEDEVTKIEGESSEDEDGNLALNQGIIDDIEDILRDLDDDEEDDDDSSTSDDADPV